MQSEVMEGIRAREEVLAARPDVEAIVHTHSMFCTSISCLRRPLPAVQRFEAGRVTLQLPAAA